ncbi:S-layer homology domain-containing protein [Paenibacillus rigui]|uniref:SLH domain-containing protein n=1 Tax=Paenibacillus rigui TaxID=554312 RepID=A0A229UIT8_9BACL|nr:S-layer homology domain-containing protein [Paenibacillus rigui]OXM82829.1 hypothetical protein CF651_28740 [Paenibacillus rigui]
MNYKFVKKRLHTVLALLMAGVGCLAPVLPNGGSASAEALDGSGTGIISTFAGGPGAGKATSVGQMPFDLFVTSHFIYVSDPANSVIRRIDKATSEEVVVAGNGIRGNTGDGGAATAAQLLPWGVALDNNDNMYITDNFSSTIRKVDAGGTISTVDMGQDYTLSRPTDVAFDKYGALYIADSGHSRILKVEAQGKVLALAAGLHQPKGLVVDYNNNGEPVLYVADTNNHTILAVTSDGTVSTVIGEAGTTTLGVNGAAALPTPLKFPHGLAIDSSHNLYIADQSNNVIRKMDTSGNISTVATGSVALANPLSVAVDTNGDLFIADTGSHLIRKVDATGNVSTIGGNGESNYSGDGERAVNAQLSEPISTAVDGAGNVYIADTANQRVRKVDAATGIIHTIAGTGIFGNNGDDIPATEAQLSGPEGVAVDGAGNVYIMGTGDNRIRKIDAVTKKISTVKELEESSLTGIAVDNKGNLYISTSEGIGKLNLTTGNIDFILHSDDAQIYSAYGIAVDSKGSIYFIDSGRSDAVSKVDVNGNISVYATGFIGPRGLAIDRNDNLYVAETSGRRVLQVDPSGTVTTVAGIPGANELIGDGGPATKAPLYNPTGVAVDLSGDIYIADPGNANIRKVDVPAIPAGALSASAAAGSAFGTTAVTASVYEGNHLIVQVSPARIATPSVGDEVPTGTGILAPYISGTSIAGVDAVTNKYVGVYEVNGYGRVISFKLIALTAAEINSDDPFAYPSYLTGLTLSTGTLSPAFASGITDYSVVVPNGVDALTVTAVVYKAEQHTVTASVYDNTGAKVLGPVDLVSGMPSNALPLRVGNNGIWLNVTGEKGTSQTYKVTVTRAASSNGSKSSTGGTSAPASRPSQDFKIIVDGEPFEQIALGEETNENGKIGFTVKMDAALLSAQLAKAGGKPVIVIPVTSTADQVSVVLTGDAVKALEGKQATLDIRTPNGNYSLPAAEVSIDRLAQQLDGQAKLADIMVHVDIAKSDAAKRQQLETSALKGHYKVVAQPVDYTITAVYNGKTAEVDKFASYVNREIPLADGVNQITTAIVIENDGAVRHVPTYMKVREGKRYAVVSSLTNSTYAVIWHPGTFADVEGHWSKAAVNDIASRMVINGVDEMHFKPDAAITRAEFAGLIVRALGLADNDKTSAFTDVRPGDWYVGAVAKAQEYGIINGYEDGTFCPNKTITREEAMVIIARAMKLAGLEPAISGTEAESVLSEFADGKAVNAWAKQAVAAVVKKGLANGSEAGLVPAGEITRAETAAIVQRLLMKAALIDDKS